MTNKHFTTLFLIAGLILVPLLTNAQEFPIAAGTDTTFSGGAVYGGLNGIVAIQGDSTSQYHITAQLLGGPGQLIGPRISLGASGIMPGAVPAFDGTNYFLVWLEFSGTVKGQFISTSGSLIGTAITIATNVSFEHFPYGVVFADTTYLVLFVKTDGYLYGQRVSKAGSLLGSQFQISSNFARDFSVAFDGTNFLVAWVEVIPDTDKDIFGQFVSKSGSLVGTNFVIDNGPNYSDNGTSLAFDGTRYLLGYHESPARNTKWTLLGRFITTTGIVQETITICDSSKTPNTAVVATDGNQYLITWMQGSNGSIMARFFNKSGTPIDTPFVVMGPLGKKVPFGGVGFGGGAYLVVAARVDSNFTNGDVYGRFIQPYGTPSAQTASDYYLPLRVGNYLQFHSSDRATTYSIIQSDSIAGHLYFLEKRSEVMVGSGATNVYALFWLREDAAGEIIMGAMGVTGSVDGSWSSKLDSATKFTPPAPYFSNTFIVPGNVRRYSMEDYSWVDTTMSNTETVQSTAGTFLNCVKIKQTKTKTSNDSLIYVEYTWYAPGMGVVKVARDGWSAYDLVGHNTTTSVGGENQSAVPAGFELSQNYPNPFNPTTTIRFELPLRSRVGLTIYNTLGQRVAELANEEMNAGYFERTWDANVASGLYFYRIEAVSVSDPTKRFVDVKKMILLK